MNFMGLSSNFSKLLEKATSKLNIEPDWPTILSICDLIRQGDITPKNALIAINKKIVNENPHTAGFGLLVLESCVKNCGALIHDEVCTKQYMEQLKEIAKTTQQESVKNKILELIQAWAYAFRDVPKYRAVQDTMRIMKAESFEFPQLKESDAMFKADTAPEWVDGDKCHRCRTMFTVVQRKHHCRNCGQVFCGQCSNKLSMIPRFGIEKEVRVCDTCYEQINKPVVAPSKESDLPIEYLTSSLAQQQQVPPKKSEEELREEEELQFALALSQSEAEFKESEKKRATSAIISNSTAFSKIHYSPPPSPVSVHIPKANKSPSPSKVQEEEEVDPELAKYLNRQYWEQRQSALEEQTSRLNVTSPSAPNMGSPMPQKIIAIKQQNGEIDPDMKAFVDNLRSQVEIFVNRMKSDSSRGRSIAYDSSVQTLFMNITALHSKLLRYIQDQEDKRVYYEGLQDKLTQIKDARGALDALREEHRLALLREKQEAERKRQMQMAQKLEIMRQKKQEYLQYQRQLALNKIQEQEREMQMRQEQQKQQYKMAGAYPVVSGYMGPPSQGSPVRQMQYTGPEANYSPLPTANPTVYAYPPGATGTYTVPAGYMLQHPQQTQMMDPSAMPADNKPQMVDGQPTQNQESLGHVTVSGPSMVNEMPLPSIQQQIQPGGQPTSQPSQQHPPQQQQGSQLQNPQHIPTTGQPTSLAGHIPTTTPPGGLPGHIPTTVQPGTLPGHIPTTGPGHHPGHITGPPGQGMMPPHINPGGPGPMLPPGVTPGVMPQGMQILPNGQILRQQIMIGQGPHGPQVMPPQGMPRQMPMSGQQPHQMGPNMSMHGQMVMTSNGPMQGPQQIPGMPNMAAMQGVQMPLTQAQMMQQQQQQLSQQQQQQQQQQTQLPQQQQQPQKVENVKPEEEERKSPEVAELITFD